MKYLCALLAFLVLTLSVQPVCIAGSAPVQERCCDDRHCGAEDPGEEEEHECVLCNPFQLCSCCAFSVVPVPQFSIRFGEHPHYNELSWGTSICPDVEEPVLGFWQPPKISA